MFELVQPVRIDPQDTFLREITANVAKGKKFDPRPKLPEGFPTISVIMIVKNEWQTLARAVASCQPFAHELIIGVDSSTDEPITFAYQMAFEKMPLNKCHPFFDKVMTEERLATFAEIAEFIGMNETVLEAMCVKRSAAQPTWKEAQRCVEAVGKGEAFWLDFKNHFSNARNETIKRATGEYCLMVDGHEYFQNPNGMIAGLNSIMKVHGPFYRMAVTLDEIDSPYRQTIAQDRMFKRTEGAHYERGVHNMLRIPEEDRETCEIVHIQNLILVHDRPQWLAHYREPQRHQMTKTHMGSEDDVSSLYYAGLSAHRKGDLEAARRKYEEYLDKNSEGPEAAYIASQMARSYMMEDRLEAAYDWAIKGGEMCPAAAWCWHLAGSLLMRMEEKTEDEGEKKRLLKKSLDILRLANACEIPNSTMAVPTTAYTWETHLALADVYCRLDMAEKAVDEMRACLENDCPEEVAEQVIRMISTAQKTAIEEVQADMASKRTGKTLYICDSLQQFTRDVAMVAQEMGYEITFSAEFDSDKALLADVIWVDWADQNAVTASNFPIGDRKLIVRCHSYETYTQAPPHIRWDRVTVPVCSSEIAAKRIEDKFGITLDWEYVTVIPDPSFYPPLSKFAGKDVNFLGRFNSKKGVDLLPELASQLPDRTIRVAGTLQDERLYEGQVSRALRTRLENLCFFGHLDACEVYDFLSGGKFYVSLSPWETYSVAMMEAMLLGLHCYALDYDWTDYYEGQITICPTVYDMARMIRDNKNDSPRHESREWVIGKHAAMIEKLKEILSCPGLTQKPSESSAPSVSQGKIRVLRPTAKDSSGRISAV